MRQHEVLEGALAWDRGSCLGLSYNRVDQAVARRFAEAFEGQGLSVWWDMTLRSGEVSGSEGILGPRGPELIPSFTPPPPISVPRPVIAAFS